MAVSLISVVIIALGVAGFVQSTISLAKIGNLPPISTPVSNGISRLMALEDGFNQIAMEFGTPQYLENGTCYTSVLNTPVTYSLVSLTIHSRIFYYVQFDPIYFLPLFGEAVTLGGGMSPAFFLDERILRAPDIFTTAIVLFQNCGPVLQTFDLDNTFNRIPIAQYAQFQGCSVPGGCSLDFGNGFAFVDYLLSSASNYPVFRIMIRKLITTPPFGTVAINPGDYMNITVPTIFFLNG